MPSAPYDIIETILNAARVRLNDAIQSLRGDILTDDAPFTTQAVNNAWRRFQRRLASLGYQGLETEAAIFSALPVVSGTDPATQVSLSWSGYFNGATTDDTIALPQIFMAPLELWERPNGSAGNFNRMDLILNGLPMVQKHDWNQIWEWRADAIWMAGALALTDLRIRFQRYFADFTDISAEGGSSQVVPIMECLDPFSLYVAYEMAGAREDMDATTLLSMADQAAALIAMRQSQDDRETYKASEFGKMRDGMTPKEDS
jgi:hypothetical protein